KEKIEIVKQPTMKKGSLPETPNENLQMKVVQNTAQEQKKDSVIEDQPLAHNDNGNTGQIGVPEGVDGGVNTIPNLVPVAPTPSPTPVPWAEVMPEFIGGESAMMSFIKNRLEFPVVERENGISGNVIVSFVVNEDGSVSDIKTLKATTKNFQRASEDVVAQFPKFKPGKQGDKPVKVRMTIPIKFVAE
ncbi:MAG TPA: energy transducer TonB, partial [Chitinophagales bacterium]